MSGHSKWSTIKRKKEATDAKKGQIFTKVAREISVAAKQGGGDPETNFRLRLAIQRAKSVNMPADNVKRAIDKATSEGAASNYEEITYEGYGPGGTAFLIEALTDNRNRTVSEVRNVLNRGGGRMAETGSVGWLFDERGLLAVEPAPGQDVDEVTLAAIEAGAEDVNEDVGDGTVEVFTSPNDLKRVEEALSAEGVNVLSAERTFAPKTLVELSEAETASVLRLLERLEDLDDVQGVYANLQVGDDVAVNLSA